jgi:uncharacterized protein YjbI with pentapeptide repeats
MGVPAGKRVNCAAHLGRVELRTFIDEVARDHYWDARGMRLTNDLVQRFLTGRDKSSALAVDFRHATFVEEVSFEETTFGEAHFEYAEFDWAVNFDNARFTRLAGFRHARFWNSATFQSARFEGDTGFRHVAMNGCTFTSAQFGGRTWFEHSALGDAEFTSAYFTGPVWFDQASLTPNFNNAQFTRKASFRDTSFKSALLSQVVFQQEVDFTEARFIGETSFATTTFRAPVSFFGTAFRDDVDLGATFREPAPLNGVRCRRTMSLRTANLDNAERIGPILAGTLELDHLTFPKTIEVLAGGGTLSCKGTQFVGGVTMRLHRVRVDASQAVFAANSSITGVSEPFQPRLRNRRWLEGWNNPTVGLISGDAWRPVLMSLTGTDLSTLSISDVNLQWCQFAGAHHLDELRIEGHCDFNTPPTGTRRQTLSEEHFWRGWAEKHPLGAETSRISPERLAVLYRSLRKALEDGKNEAGAGDFYYGEMEARRHASTNSRAERLILWFYWALSGYGQRAARALTWLAGLLVTVTLVLTMFGLPQPAKQQISGTVDAGRATLEVTEPATALPALGDRWTVARAERATQIALGAMVFRDAGQRLTTVGSWTVTIARIVGPILLALAALAIRARVKR